MTVRNKRKETIKKDLLNGAYFAHLFYLLRSGKMSNSNGVH